MWSFGVRVRLFLSGQPWIDYAPFLSRSFLSVKWACRAFARISGVIHEKPSARRSMTSSTPSSSYLSVLLSVKQALDHCCYGSCHFFFFFPFGSVDLRTAESPLRALNTFKKISAPVLGWLVMFFLPEMVTASSCGAGGPGQHPSLMGVTWSPLHLSFLPSSKDQSC